MRGIPLGVQDKGGLPEVEEAAAATDFNWKNIITATTTSGSSGGNKKRNYKGEGLEPRSVLDNNTSPSPSSSLGGGGGGGAGGSTDTADVAAVSDNPNPPRWPERREDRWASELHSIPHSAIDAVGPTEDWEAMLSDSPGQEQTFLRWIMADTDESKSQLHPQMLSQHEFNTTTNLNFGSSEVAAADAGFGFQPFVSLLPPPVPNSLPMLFYQQQQQQPVEEEKAPFFNNPQAQNPAAFFLPLPQNDHHHHHHLMIPPPQLKQQQQRPFPPQIIVNPPSPPPPVLLPYQLQQQRPGKPKDENAALAQQQQLQQKALVDQLFKAAELVEAGNSPGAREILARLNHHLPASPFGLKPLLRSVIYFLKALHHLLLPNIGSTIPVPTISNHLDVVLKLNAYKSFSEVSPFLHFTNFTSTQTLLEELGPSDPIHLVDFDIGVGGHWSSFMQELAHRRGPTIPLLKITAYVSPSSFHPLELHLTRQNLAHFASDLNIPFELNILAVESFDPNELLAVSYNEAIAVNLPVGCHYSLPFPTLLRLVKQLNPKVVVSVEHGCDRSDLSFSHSFLHHFQSCMVLLDSIDAAGTNSDIASKIERFLIQPRIEGAVIGRHRAIEKIHPWRGIFTSVGFVPVQFSNFTETQAECLLKRVQVRGFHVEKRHASLFLYWQRGELGSVSAWRC